MSRVPSDRRPRVSLLTLLLVTTIVAMALVIGIQANRVSALQSKLSSNVHRLQHELKQLKNYELGSLAITEEDSDKVHAICPQRRGIQARLERAIRVYLPKSVRYRLTVYQGVLPTKTHPSQAKERLQAVREQATARYPAADGHEIAPGEYDLFLQLTRVAESQHDWDVAIEGQRVGDKISGGLLSTYRLSAPWLADPMLARMRLGVGPHQLVVEPGEPVQLVSIIKAVEVPRPSGLRATRGPKQPAQGIEFWLEPAP